MCPEYIKILYGINKHDIILADEGTQDHSSRVQSKNVFIKTE